MPLPDFNDLGSISDLKSIPVRCSSPVLRVFERIVVGIWDFLCLDLRIGVGLNGTYFPVNSHSWETLHSSYATFGSRFIRLTKRVTHGGTGDVPC